MLNEIFMTIPDHRVTGRCTYLLSDLLQRRQSGATAHDFGSLHRKQKAPEVSPRQCVRDRSLAVET